MLFSKINCHNRLLLISPAPFFFTFWPYKDKRLSILILKIWRVVSIPSSVWYRCDALQSYINATINPTMLSISLSLSPWTSSSRGVLRVPQRIPLYDVISVISYSWVSLYLSRGKGWDSSFTSLADFCHMFISFRIRSPTLCDSSSIFCSYYSSKESFACLLIQCSSST